MTELAVQLDKSGVGGFASNLDDNQGSVQRFVVRLKLPTLTGPATLECAKGALSGNCAVRQTQNTIAHRPDRADHTQLARDG